MPQKNFTQKKHTRSNEKSNKDKLRERIAAKKTLSHDDRRTFAINLGKLAASLNPDDPKAGVKKIIEKSQKHEVWEKRKRFFRLPGEDTPLSSKAVSYNANPLQFLKLAEVAGQLMSRSNSEGVVDKSVEKAYKDLIKGSSLSAPFSLETSADQSLKSLLDEYGGRLAEAIENRTKIVELWKALDTSPINLNVFEDKAYKSIEASPFGDAAIFPSELLQPAYWSSLTHGRLEPSQMLGYVNDSWAEPLLELGILAFDYDVRLFCVPKEKHELFEERYYGQNDYISVNEAGIAHWLHEIGFDFTELWPTDALPDLYYDIDGFGWKTFKVSLLHKVGLRVSRNSKDKVEIQLYVRTIRGFPNSDNTDCLFTVHTGTRTPGVLVEAELSYVDSSASSCSYEDIVLPVPDEKGNLVGTLEDDTADAYVLELFKNFLGGTDELIAIMSPDWQTNPDYWADEELGKQYQNIKWGGSWSDDDTVARLLFGAENIRFYPKVAQSEPVGRAARAGSISASLLQNAEIASDENRITKLLIDRVALTANSGLAFYEAMLDAHREAIRKI